MRLDGTSETARKKGPWRRLVLRRADGQVYLSRWGFGHDRVGRVLLHRMDAPDPGLDLHDHPWSFVSIVLRGGYTEVRCDARITSGDRVNARRPGSVQLMRLDETHTIVRLHRQRCWTLVIGGPRRRRWGFYVNGKWMPEAEYDATIRAGRRDLFVETSRARQSTA